MAVAMLFIGAGVSILPAAYAEIFPTRNRTVGLAVPYSIAVAAFGGTAPYLQEWIGQTAGRSAFPAAYLGDARGVPGLTRDGAAWLADHGVRAVGADTIAAEHIPPGSAQPALPVHRLLLAERGINLIEVMNLEGLAARHIDEFLFVGAPLNVAGATGAPIRPLALIGP